MAPIDNRSLEFRHVPAPEASDDAMLAFSATFPGYEVWGGVEPCGLVANEVDRIWNESGTLPSSLTLLRTALFFEARRERFVDYGGFSDDPRGVLEHRRYMRLLLDEIRALATGSGREAEDEAVVSWLETHAPAGSAYLEDYAADPAWPDIGPPRLDDDHVAAAVALAARMLAIDLRAGVKVNENRLRERLCLAFEHVAPVTVERERQMPVPGFQGVGPVDVLLHDYTSGVLRGLIECKWSADLKRDKIYEGACDAIKLALAEAGDAGRWLVTGAPNSAWLDTETPDLFADGSVDTVDLWGRGLNTPGPNGGTAVGADIQAGGRGNMFTHAPERLRIKLVADTGIPGAETRIRAARITGAGRLVHFADAPEFPRVIGDRWLREHVPRMADDQFDRLVARLRAKRWTDDDLAQRVLPLRGNEERHATP